MSTGTVKQGKDRHQEILDAAARVITDRGLAETRISDIADEAGVSPGLILYYFESKDRLPTTRASARLTSRALRAREPSHLATPESASRRGR